MSTTMTRTEPKQAIAPSAERSDPTWTERYARPDARWCRLSGGDLERAQAQFDEAERKRLAYVKLNAEARERREQREQAAKTEQQNKAEATEQARVAKHKATVLDAARRRFLAAGGSSAAWTAEEQEKVWQRHLSDVAMGVPASADELARRRNAARYQ